MIELHDERNLVGVLAATRAKDAERGGDGVAAALDRELDDVLRIEVDRHLGEAGAGGMLDALIDRQDRDIPGAAQAAGVDNLLEIPKHGRLAVRHRQHPIDEIRAGQMQRFFGNPLAL